MDQPAPFLFGKLPAHGDFIARGLDESVRAAWDDWATEELLDARTRLAETFDAAHDSAPPIRFISGPGVLGGHWRAGALAPSIDAVGRRFVVLMGIDGLDAPEAAALGAMVADRCEGTVRQALVDNLAADAALEALSACAPALGEIAAAAALSAQAATGVWWRPDGVVAGGEAPPAGFLRDGLVAAAPVRAA